MFEHRMARFWHRPEAAAEDYDFARFPRQNLTLQLSRRKLFASVRTEFQVHLGRSQGGTGYKLHKLGSCSDAQLVALVPVVLTDCDISIKNKTVWGRSPTQRKATPLFLQTSPALLVFNRFNGLLSLQQVALCLSQEQKWSSEYSFAYVRGVFLHLVERGICVPQ